MRANDRCWTDQKFSRMTIRVGHKQMSTALVNSSFAGDAPVFNVGVEPTCAPESDIVKLSSWGVLAASLVLNGMAVAQAPADLTGLWRANAQVSGADIPFSLNFTVQGETVRANFYDGRRATNPSAPGTFAAGHVHVTFPSYAAVLDASIVNGELTGTYTKNHEAIQLHAVKDRRRPPVAVSAPIINGEWIVPYKSAKGEKAWRLIVHQTAAAAEATILRVDGDTGTLNGRFADGAFRLSHFAGERPALLEIRSQPDRQLKLTLVDGDGRQDLIALRPKAALAQGVAPADPTRFTSVKDPGAPFQFSFPDLAGRTVSNSDPKFRGKVVVVDVMGSWCPNCHDEAPFLQSLYARRHQQGLEVVALDFEQPDQLADPQRLRAFIARYGIGYTVLLAGQPKDVHEKLPQAVNFAAWPTTFFIGRDGRVKSTHVGFTSPGSGRLDVETKTSVEREVQALLAERGAG